MPEPTDEERLNELQPDEVPAAAVDLMAALKASIQRGTCRTCDRSILLNKDGTVRRRGSDVWYAGRREYRCDGAGQKPKEADRG